MSGMPPQGVTPLPPGFLEELSAKQEADGNLDGLKDFLLPVGKFPLTLFAGLLQGANVLSHVHTQAP